MLSTTGDMGWIHVRCVYLLLPRQSALQQDPAGIQTTSDLETGVLLYTDYVSMRST